MSVITGPLDSGNGQPGRNEHDVNRPCVKINFIHTVLCCATGAGAGLTVKDCLCRLRLVT